MIIYCKCLSAEFFVRSTVATCELTKKRQTTQYIDIKEAL